MFAALIRRLPEVLERSPGWSPQARACAGTATCSQQVNLPEPARAPAHRRCHRRADRTDGQGESDFRSAAATRSPDTTRGRQTARTSAAIASAARGTAGHPVIGQMQIRVDSMGACPARACTASKAIPASRSRIRRPGSPPKHDQRPKRIFVGRYHDPHQGTAPSSLNRPPVGPSAGSSATCTAIAAPCAAVRSTFRPRARVTSVAQAPESAALTSI